MQDSGDPQTRTDATVALVSAFSTMRWPSVDPTASAIPNGWKLSDTTSKDT